MADYYSTVAKAVGGLDRNTGEARRRLYGRARAALLAEMRGAYPALDQSDITAAQMSLEEAIGKIEADAEPDERTHQAIDTPLAASPRGSVATLQHVPTVPIWLQELTRPQPPPPRERGVFWSRAVKFLMTCAIAAFRERGVFCSPPSSS